MHYRATADTDAGIVKDTNQDSILIKHATTDIGEVLMAIVCDGMGGLAKGELASATVIRTFSKWFDENLPYELIHGDLQTIGDLWVGILKALNCKIRQYGQRLGANLGTTFSGILFVHDRYVIVHVGDTRIYRLDTELTQLTADQTVVNKEILLGMLTPEQAKTDRRRSMLLQCVGASPVVEPQVICGNAREGAYMLCSDGFRHVITPHEIYASLQPDMLKDPETMHGQARYLIDLVKSRKERDNISVVLIQAKRGEGV